MLDINAAQSAQENIKLPQETIKKSAAAISGESYRGDVQLPLKLQDNVQLQIDREGFAFPFFPFANFLESLRRHLRRRR